MGQHEDIAALRLAMESNPGVRAQAERSATRYDLLGHAKDWSDAEAIQVMTLYEVAIAAEESGAGTETVRALFLRAAEAGHANAMVRCSDFGRDDHDSESYTKWLTRAAEAKDVSSMYRLGAHLALAGEFGRASIWLQQASDAGHVEAARDLGKIYLELRRYEIAEHWLRIAIRGGSVSAITDLGLVRYNQGNMGQARELWLEAARKGDSLAQENLQYVH